MKQLAVVFVVALALSLVACKSKDDKAGGESSSSAAPSGLEMSSDSAACKKAMKCCEERVKAEKGGVNPDDLNLMCSGVALADTDETCDQFRAGYAASFESQGTAVPDACK